jgi:hypothetical protein
MRSTVGTYTCRHTVEILTWREYAAEQLAPARAYLHAHMPVIRPRRITFVRRGTVAA